MARLKVLRPPQLVCLPLHFLYLPALRVRLRARVDNGDSREKRSRYSGEKARIDIHTR